MHGRGLRLPVEILFSGQYHPNGRYVLMTMDDAAVRIYDAKTGDEVAVLIGFRRWRMAYNNSRWLL